MDIPDDELMGLVRLGLVSRESFLEVIRAREEQVAPPSFRVPEYMRQSYESLVEVSEAQRQVNEVTRLMEERLWQTYGPQSGYVRFSERIGVRQEAQGGTEMNLKAEFDAASLTAAQRVELKGFYKTQLRGQFVKWPLRDGFVGFYKNGRLTSVHGNTEWASHDGYVYVGYSRAGEMDVQERLGVLACLMGVTGHAGDPELQGEFAAALGRVLAGVYEGTVSALVKASGPVEKLAFSERGSAAWMDGAWVGPSGDSVTVGEDWVVVEVKRGEVELESAARAASPTVGEARWVEWARNSQTGRFLESVFTRTPLYVNYGSRRSAQDLIDEAVIAGVTGLEIVEADRGGYRVQMGQVAPVAAPQPVRETWEEMLERIGYSTRTLPDGRPYVDYYMSETGARNAMELVGQRPDWAGRLEIVQDGHWWGFAERVAPVVVARPTEAFDEFAGRYGWNPREGGGRVVIAGDSGTAHGVAATAREAGFDVEVVEHNPTTWHVREVRPIAVTPSQTLRQWLTNAGLDFTLAREPLRYECNSDSREMADQVFGEMVAAGVTGIEVGVFEGCWCVLEARPQGRVRRTLGEWLREPGNYRGTHSVNGRMMIPWGTEEFGREHAEDDLRLTREFGVDSEIVEMDGILYVAERQTVDF